MSDAFGALFGFQEVSHEGDGEGDEADELVAHVGEGCVQALEGGPQESFVGEDCPEKDAH